MSRSPSLVLALLLSALAGSCSSDGGAEGQACTEHVRAAIFNGTPSATELGLSLVERAALGSLEGAAPGDLCTATVVRPSWALTASHCNLPGDLGFRSSDPSVPLIPIDGRKAHPSLDVLLVHLSVPPVLRALAIRTARIDETWLGRVVTLAGVGVTETDSSGELRFAKEPIVALSGDEIAVDGRGDSGACVGDSGGPLLLRENGVLQILGTLVHGETSCLGVDYYLRTDRFAVWIDEVAGGEYESHSACD